VEFRGEERCNDTHPSATDPEARLYRKSKGKETKLAFMGQVLMEHRNGLAVSSSLTMATGTAEREAAISMVEDVVTSHGITVANDKAYDDARFVRELRGLNATPHIARKDKSSATDGRTTSQPGYGVSQRIRERVQEIFG
jgi:hypothetical protein